MSTEASPRWYPTAALGIFACALAGGAIIASLPAETPLLTLLFIEVGSFHVMGIACVLVCAWLLSPPGERLRSLALERPTYRIVVETWHALPRVYIGMIACQILALPILYALGVDLTPQFALEALVEESAGTVAVLAVSAVVVAPFAEELFFRLVGYRSLRLYLGPKLSQHLVALLFATIHMSITQLAALYYMGYKLQELERRHDSLWLPIAFHAAFNGIMTGIVLGARIASSLNDA